MLCNASLSSNLNLKKIAIIVECSERSTQHTHTAKLDNIEERIETGFTIFFGFCLSLVASRAASVLVARWTRRMREREENGKAIAVQIVKAKLDSVQERSTNTHVQSPSRSRSLARLNMNMTVT